MKIKYALIIITLILLFQTCSYGTEFIDIENHWAKTEIEESIANDIVNGYEDNTFRPEVGITLAEYLKIIIKSAKFDLVREGCYFPDYFIATAKQRGLILENEFEDYNKKLTRNEIARITARYINVEAVKKSRIVLKDIEAEYKDEILKLITLDIIKGYGDKTYKGDKNVTRAEAIVIVRRATEKRRELISNRKYQDDEKTYLTNININNMTESNREITYNIKNKKIYVSDNGRYSTLNRYEISDKNINLEKTIKIINIAVDEDSYTEVLYVPYEGVLNQLIIRRGENKSTTEKGGYDFEFTYFEDKEYELKRISQIDMSGEKCYMKIEVCKMWRDAAKLNQKDYIDKYKKEKFEKCMETEFGIMHGEKISKYILEKYEQKISGKTRGIEEAEQKNFGKYTVNYYKKTDGNPAFYISKNI